MIFERKRRIWPWIILSLFLLFGGGIIFAFQWLKSVNIETALQNPFVQREIVRQVGEEHKDIVSLVPTFLGFDEPQTYLLLFLNNTEIRPGGGFIGVYATLRVSEGHVETLAVDGTEVLDRNAPADWKITPPQPLKEQLGVDRWYFRDSNWSPDFAVSAQKALEFYTAEGGIGAQEVDGVIGVTPTVLEELLRVTGPITVQNVQFTADNVVEKLEHEVEYNYVNKGIARENRKQIIDPMMHELIARIRKDILFKSDEYRQYAENLMDEKHIMIWHKDSELQNALEREGWAGRVINTNQDYLMYVDANLAALKTDHAMERALTYSFEKEGNDIIANVTMQYKNKGVFDWRTTRYRTYARVFAPLGSQLIEVKGAMKNNKQEDNMAFDSGEELGKTWFGAFIVIEPGKEKTLTFRYKLPTSLAASLQNGEYHLLYQKQPGIPESRLTLDLNFDKNIQSASPGEPKNFWGDTRYQWSDMVKQDKTFDIKVGL